MTRCFRLLIALLLIGGLGIAATPALASTPARAGAPARAATHTSSHTCPGLPHYATGPHVWTDLHDENSPLVLNMRRMVCSAADHATIDIKMWYVAVTDDTVALFVHDLALMHAYHHVRVNVFVGRNAYRYNSTARNWLAFVHAFSFAHLYSCHSACISRTPGGVAHSKWITVSQLRHNGPAALTTSTNISGQQFGQAQSGIFVANNPSFYGALVKRWNVYLSCTHGGHCDRTLSPAGWRQHGSMSIYFAPTSSDPIGELLSHVSCARGGQVQVVSLYLFRSLIRQQLVRLRAAGCDVQLLVEHPPTSQSVIDALQPRCYQDHDKFVVVNTPTEHVVIAGSEDLSLKALNVNDNEMVRTSKAAVVAGYHHFMHLLWTRSGRCHSA